MIFRSKFDINEYIGSVIIDDAETFIKDKSNAILGKRLRDMLLVDDVMIESGIGKMEVGCAPSLDDVMTEDL